MTLNETLLERPILYEVVPPKLTATKAVIAKKLELLESVLYDTRINAINVPELVERNENDHLVYVPNTVLPDEYASIIRDRGKEAVVNIVAPRLTINEFQDRVYKLWSYYKIGNLVLVGKERSTDVLPGPSVTQALDLVSQMNGGRVSYAERTNFLVGGISIFHRNKKKNHGYETASEDLDEHERIAIKARHGCRFVTSQIIFDPSHAIDFLTKYNNYCETRKVKPLTVFVSLSTVASPSILSLLTDKLEVYMPDELKKKLHDNQDRMEKLSVDASEQIFSDVAETKKSKGIKIPIGLHIEQVGVNSTDLSMELLDRVYPIFRNL